MVEIGTSGPHRADPKVLFDMSKPESPPATAPQQRQTARIVVETFHKAYEQTVAVVDVSFQVGAGEIWGLETDSMSM